MTDSEQANPLIVESIHARVADGAAEYLDRLLNRGILLDVAIVLANGYASVLLAALWQSAGRARGSEVQ